jgi:MATE family multidrug resistance protein
VTLVRAEIRENLRLAGPIALGQLGMMAMGIVDTALVGRVSENELAGVALGNNLVFALAMPAMGVFLAIEPIASQALGAGDRKQAHASFRAGVALAAALSLPVAILAVASLALLPLLKVDAQAIPGAHRYVLSRLPSLLPYFVFLAAKTYQQAAQRPRAAVEAVIVANVVHAAVGYVAVFGKFGLPALGGVGAGVATSASSLLMMTWVLVRGRQKETERGSARAIAPKLLRIGIPIGLQLAAEVGIFSLVALLMGRLGGRAIAAHQIAIGLASVSFMGALGIAQATSVRVGTFSGGGDRPGAERAGWIGIALGVSVMGISAIVFGTMPRLLARAFTDKEEVVAAAAALIQIAAFFQLADGAQVVSAGALRGAADTRFPLVANVLVHWGVGLPLAWFCGFTLGWGARGLWVGLTAGLFLIAISLVARYRVVSARPLARLLG